MCQVQVHRLQVQVPKNGTRVQVLDSSTTSLILVERINSEKNSVIVNLSLICWSQSYRNKIFTESLSIDHSDHRPLKKLIVAYNLDNTANATSFKVTGWILCLEVLNYFELTIWYWWNLACKVVISSLIVYTRRHDVIRSSHQQHSSDLPNHRQWWYLISSMVRSWWRYCFLCQF